MEPEEHLLLYGLLKKRCSCVSWNSNLYKDSFCEIISIRHPRKCCRNESEHPGISQIFQKDFWLDACGYLEMVLALFYNKRNVC